MSKKNEPLNVRVTRLQQSRYEREQQQRKWVLLGALAVGVLTVALVAAALLDMFVIQPQRMVATVGGQAISVTALQKRMRYDQGQIVNQYNRLSQQVQQAQQSQDPSAQFLIQYFQQQLQQLVGQASATSIATGALNTLEDGLLIKQEAQKRGITVAAPEVQGNLEKSLGYFTQTLTPFPTNTAEPTLTLAPTLKATVAVTQTPVPTVVQPTDTPRVQPTSIRQDEFTLLFQRTADGYKDIGMTEADIRGIVEDNLYRERLQKIFADATPKDALHFKFDFIRFSTDADAKKALDRLTAKQITFPALISETNAITQPAVIGNGQSLDWTSQTRVVSQYGDNIASALNVKSIGAPTGVITSADGGFYVLLPLGREVRALAENELQSNQQQAFTTWLTSARNDPLKVARSIDPTSVIPTEVRKAADNFVAQYGSTVPQQ